MRIHSDIITWDDLHDARLAAISHGEGHVWLDGSKHGSRKRDHAFEVGLEGDGTTNKRRRNPGTSTSNRDLGYAATHDQWGWFLAYLFALDPNMTSVYYDGAEDFHAKTKEAFR